VKVSIQPSISRYADLACISALSMAGGTPPTGCGSRQEVIDKIKSKHCRILVVEDHAIFARAVELMLTDTYGATVQLVKRGHSAVEKCGRERFHLVLMDVVLPGPMNGIAAYKAMRQAGIMVPVVLMSAFRRHDGETKALGVIILPKPFDYKLLEPFLLECGDDQ
jgi:CheY-like chemotaxis protein